MRTKSTGGFTLIELLIVIAIIGILAAVLIPNLMNARTTAAQRAAQAHSSSVYTALIAALADNINAEVSDLVADCQDGGDIAFSGGAGEDNTDSNYSINPAPAGSTCEIDVEDTTDPQVTVTHTASGKVFINGVDQDTVD